MIAWEILDAEPPAKPAPRTFCGLCGDELPGDYHPAVLLITHHKFNHAADTIDRAAA